MRSNRDSEDAFTLAEVLLTLAIIGVVAALTIPAVITKATKQQYVTGLKKSFNTLKQVEREATRVYGPMENWDWDDIQRAIPPGMISDSEVFGRYFKPYFDIMTDCSGSGDTSSPCFADGDENYSDVKQDLYCKMGHCSRTIDSFGDKIMTPDGISYAYHPYGGETNGVSAAGMFYVDINGSKGPNLQGRDLFAFYVFPKMGIKPVGSYEESGKPISKVVCASKSLDLDCTAKVLTEGTMDY